MTPLRPPPLSLLDRYRGREPQTLYSTTVTVTGGAAEHGRASGVARSDDGRLDVELRLPSALGGPGDGPNPEQLFAASYAACFHGALSLLAARAGVSVRTLHRTFHASGETFWNWIPDRRLDRCYAGLTTPIQYKRTITEVAFRWGFNELSTFDRNFRKRYGASPRNVRAGGEAQAT